MSLKKNWAELQRRHVVKAGIAYLVSSWLIVQVVGYILDAFQYEIDYKQTLIIILAVGFPIWLIIAWIYDFSPEGITKTGSTTDDPEISRKKNIGLNRFIIGGLATAVILLGFTNYKSYAKAKKLETERTELFQNAIDTNYMASIAVLLFDAIGGPDQDITAYPTGIGQEIHQELTKIKDLRVVSTTSSYQIDKETMNIKTIGDTLKVDYILDGNVIQFQDTYAKINVKLINTQNDNTLWAKEFNFEISDVLSVWDDIAKQVSDFVGLTKEHDDVRNKKVDPEAYKLYLQAYNIQFKKTDSSEKADSLVRASIKIDNTYAPSHILLCFTSMAKSNDHLISFEEMKKIGKAAVIRALELEPKNSKALAWLSNYKWFEGDYEASRRLVDSIYKYGKDDNMALLYLTHFNARINQQKKAYDLIKKAIVLDPNFYEPYSFAMEFNLMFNKPNKALVYYKKYKELENRNSAVVWDGYRVYKEVGDYDKALQLIEEYPVDNLEGTFDQLMMKQSILWLEGDVNKANQLLQEALKIPKDSIGNYREHEISRVYAERKENDLAFTYLDKAYDYIIEDVANLFNYPEFKNLYDDPRWDAYLKRLGEYYNYDYTQSE